MGTRHLIMVVVDKKMKVAQYGQWDGYLSGQGLTVAKFIHDKLVPPNSIKMMGVKGVNLNKFRKAVRECSFYTDGQFKDLQTKIEYLKDDEFIKSYPELSRDTGAEILGLLFKKGGLKLKDGSDFIKESLFCEWAYLLDLDKEVLEIYQGFNTEPLPKGQRFSNLKPNEKKGAMSGETYYPCKLLKKIPFCQVSVQAMKALNDELNKKAEEEENAKEKSNG